MCNYYNYIAIKVGIKHLSLLLIGDEYFALIVLEVNSLVDLLYINYDRLNRLTTLVHLLFRITFSPFPFVLRKLKGLKRYQKILRAVK